MILRNHIAVLFFVLLSFAAAAQQNISSLNSAEWLRMITANAVNKKGQSVRSGYALYFSQAGNVSVPYLVYVPRKYDPARATPVVVFLHGAILARDSFHHKDPGIADEPIFSIGDTLNTIVVFPFSKSNFAWPAQQEACENIITIIGQVREHYNVDGKKIYLGGISMGGAGTYWFINNRPELFAGFYTFSAIPGSIKDFSRITTQKPLYAIYAEDDPSVSYREVLSIYDQHKKEAPGWHISSVKTGGHRFIYRAGGFRIIAHTLGKLMHP